MAQIEIDPGLYNGVTDRYYKQPTYVDEKEYRAERSAAYAADVMRERKREQYFEDRRADARSSYFAEQDARYRAENARREAEIEENIRKEREQQRIERKQRLQDLRNKWRQKNSLWRFFHMKYNPFKIAMDDSITNSELEHVGKVL